jgi:predicted Zn-dependent peptidase
MPRPWYFLKHLDSGLPVLAAPTHSPSVTAVFMVKAGSKNEIPAQAGISHFLEHFVFRGTAKFKTGREVVRALDRLGADHNASTSKEATAYWVRAAAACLPQTLEFLSEIILRPSLPQKLMAREKGTILQEMAMIEDHPMSKIGEDFEKLFFGPGHPLGRPIIGRRDTVSGLTRPDLVAYRNRFYNPPNIVLAVAGGVKSDQVFRFAENLFSKVSKSLKELKLLKLLKPEPPAAGGRLIDPRPLDQVHLALGVPAFPALDPRRYPLAILLTILGGNTSSQLFQQIRENRGLAYYIRAGSSRYQEAGYAAVRAGVPPPKAKAAVDLIIKLLTGFKMTGREFTEAKSYNQGQLALDWEESSHIAAHLASDYLFEKPVTDDNLSVHKANSNVLKNLRISHVRSFKFLANAIGKVAPGQVESLAKELFSDLGKKLFLAAIGPIDDDLKYLKSLK